MADKTDDCKSFFCMKKLIKLLLHILIFFWNHSLNQNFNPAGIYLLKVSSRKSRTRCEMLRKLKSFWHLSLRKHEACVMSVAFSRVLTAVCKLSIII